MRAFRGRQVWRAGTPSIHSLPLGMHSRGETTNSEAASGSRRSLRELLPNPELTAMQRIAWSRLGDLNPGPTHYKSALEASILPNNRWYSWLLRHCDTCSDSAFDVECFLIVPTKQSCSVTLMVARPTIRRRSQASPVRIPARGPLRLMSGPPMGWTLRTRER